MLSHTCDNEKKMENQEIKSGPDFSCKEAPFEIEKQMNPVKTGRLFSNHTKEEWGKILLDLLIFYTTAFFVLLSIISVAAMIFLVPFFIDPAWSTIRANFKENGSLCQTVKAHKMEGSNFETCFSR